MATRREAIQRRRATAGTSLRAAEVSQMRALACARARERGCVCAFARAWRECVDVRVRASLMDDVSRRIRVKERKSRAC